MFLQSRACISSTSQSIIITVRRPALQFLHSGWFFGLKRGAQLAFGCSGSGVTSWAKASCSLVICSSRRVCLCLIHMHITRPYHSSMKRQGIKPTLSVSQQQLDHGHVTACSMCIRPYVVISMGQAFTIWVTVAHGTLHTGTGRYFQVTF